MIKNTLFTITIIFLILCFSSCQKGLNLIPEDTISDKTFWKTSSDFEKAANALYNSLEDFNYLDVETDIAYSQNNEISDGSYQPTETDGRWNNAYAAIRNANIIISKASESSTPSDFKRYVAEAKFFRAYNYYMIYRYFGGVPIIDKSLDIDDEELFSSRASREDVADFILQDLEEAANDLPLKSSLTSTEIGRVTKGAANALRSRVALFEGTWGKNRGTAGFDKYLDIAISSALGVMNSSEYILFRDMGTQSYRYLFIEEGDDSRETILDDRYQKPIKTHLYPSDMAAGDLLPTKKLADSYLCSDGLPIMKSPNFNGYDQITSEFQNRDPRMTMTILIPGTEIPSQEHPDPIQSWPFFPFRNPNTGYIIYKFLSENRESNASPGGIRYDYDRHIIRFAEVLLNYAEATFEKNNTISDADLNISINLLRQRVGMPDMTNNFIVTNNLDMREEIRRERTVELALEGFRYDDLRRWKTAEIELPQAIKGIKLVGTPWTNPVVIDGVNRNPYLDPSWIGKTDDDGFIICQSASKRTFNPNKHYLQPLPTREIFINKKLEQNPEW